MILLTVINIVNDYKQETDEYQGLSYKKGEQIFSYQNLNETKTSRRKTDGDFREKYKTEKCKFWDLNKDCKYGDNVK